MKICFASNNKHKLEEVRALLAPDFTVLSLEDIGCTEELPETQPTLEGNSLQKARYVFDHYGVACFADDTGLEVEALDNEPGVYSARYAGPQKDSSDNIALLLRKLEGVSNRRARFRTVVTLVDSGGVYAFEGIVNGRIIDELRGRGGFGYDPIFLPADSAKTLAEMTLEEKNRISHRARALEKLSAWLKQNRR